MGLYAKHIFSRILDWALSGEECRRRRQETLAPARGRVLEIGFGTGLNLPHYPEAVTRLSVIDPERMLPRRVAERVSRARFPVEFRQLDAAGDLPYEDASFDTVVSTWTLCSIDDPSAALAQVRRVLKPGGQFLFMEHGRSDDPKVARWQDWYNPIHRVLACGCNLNRPMDKLIREAGLEIVRLDRFVLTDMARLLADTYRGVAYKG